MQKINNKTEINLFNLKNLKNALKSNGKYLATICPIRPHFAPKNQ